MSTAGRIERDIARQSQLMAKIARAQSDIASQTRLQAPSDDPAAAARVATLRRAQTSEATWRNNIEGGAALAARADSNLESVALLLDRARELVVTGANATLSAADRQTIARELEGLADEVATLATATDARGQQVFPDSPLRLPVGAQLSVYATTSFSQTFIAGGRTVETMLRDSAAAVVARDPSALADVAAASEQIATARGELGTRAARLETLRERLIDSATVTEEERSALEDTDIAATIARLQATQLSLEAAQSTFARVNRRTLFNLLG